MKFKSLFKGLFLSCFIIFGAQQALAATHTPVSDSVITAKVKSKIALDKSISAFNIGVTTNHGVVALDGIVDSDSQAEALFEMVQNTDGVRNINTNNLEVKNSSHPIRDSITTAKVKTMLIKKRVFDDANVPLADVHVETNNDTVYLTGTAKSNAQIARAVKIAKSVSGVKHVESRLVVTN